MKVSSRLLSFLLAGITLAFAAGAAVAQQYPSKPINLIVPQETGGSGDLLTRVVAEEMTKVLGQPVLVLNKPGAANLVGIQHVLDQPADGYTIGSFSVNAYLIPPYTKKSAKYDAAKELPAVVDLADTKLIIVSPKDRPWKTFAELLAHAKANPGKLNYASSSETTRLLTESILREKDLNVVYVPFSSTRDNMMAMANGETDFGFTTINSSRMGGDRLQALIQTGTTHDPELPADIPTFEEMGIKGIPGAAYSMNVRQGTPPDVVARIHSVVSEIIHRPDIAGRIAKIPLEVFPPASVKETQARHAALSKRFGDAAKAIGMEPK